MTKPKKELSAKARHFGVVLESIDSKVGQVLEGYSALDIRISKLDEKVERGFGDMEFQFGIVKQRLNEIDSRLTRLEDRVNRLEAEMQSSFKTILQHLINLDDELGEIRKKTDKKADLERVEALEKRVASLAVKLK